jgi:hypothetical protein
LIVKWHDLHFVRPQESRQRRLNAAIAPDLSDDSSRYPETVALFQCLGEQRDHAFLPPIQSDQRACVES